MGQPRNVDEAADARQAPASTQQELTKHFREMIPDGLELAATEEGREFLTYLVSCALSSEQGTYAVVDGKRYDFRGSIGLAPDWLDRPLTEAEERWVSAGILARTNYFGVEVIISMRNPKSGFSALEVAESEKQEFTLCEGDFFGNIFVDPPVRCVAVAPHKPEEQSDPILKLRVGTEVDPDLEPIDGKPVSRCGYVITGPIGDPAAHQFRGVQYDQYIRIYLRPQSPQKSET